MEIPEINVRQINIPEVYIPEIYKPDPVLPVITNLEIDVVGCTYQHRDIKNTGNTQLLLDDPNGVFLTCGESLFPSFYPIDYRPDQLVITEDLPITNDAPLRMLLHYECYSTKDRLRAQKRCKRNWKTHITGTVRPYYY